MLQLNTFAALPILGVGLLLGYVAYSLVQNLFISPLQSLPGPKLWGTTQLFYSQLALSGSGHKKLLAMHKKYGPVIRVGPFQVSITAPSVWKDVNGHRKGSGQLENNKDPIFYKLQGSGLIGAIDATEHGRQRRILSNAFSAKSMLEQQPLIQGHVDLLISQLKEHSHKNGEPVPVDAVKWYNLTTFDVIGDLSFGESFGCLKGSEYHPWVALIFPSLMLAVKLLEVQRYISNLDTLLQLTPMWKVLMRKRVERDELTHAKVAQRMELTVERPDFMKHMLGKGEDGVDVRDQILRDEGEEALREQS